ncbi:hypothetical protein B0H17DRAFT_918216 [Mycena rosella]|uniref:Peptidase S54 rhomboid domain-containing protein n=1 Tax=Mycena rosella TaxID=1033263 RepID=A0AAD7GXJ3_MYCRO|nr:hypothetical protein B0H17DRAFT_918216 [Mycena rosella]
MEVRAVGHHGSALTFGTGRLFDHMAHIGGAAFGAWYYMHGLRLWDNWRSIARYLFHYIVSL